MKAQFLLAGMAGALLAGCATTGTTDVASDPFEDVNRRVFAFNMSVDKAVLKPVSKGYRAVTTDDMREGVSNALANLKEPVTMANQVLQGDFAAAGETVGRFALNTTIGVGGFVDAAGHFGHERKKEDFGQTLAVWGVDSGPFIVVPLLGPSNPRDLVGSGVDMALQPLNYTQFDGDDAFRISRTAVGVVSAREGASDAIDSLDEQIDPYSAMRYLYGHLRAGAIRNGAEDPNAAEDMSQYDDY